MASRRQELWITGIGCATAVGNDFESLADNVFAGRSAIQTMTHFDARMHSCRFASTLPPLSCPEGYDADDFARRDRFTQLLIWCGVRVMRDAGLSERRRVGLVLGIGAEGMLHWERLAMEKGGAEFQPESLGAGGAHQLRSLLQINGPSTSVAAACASGNIAIGVARQWIEMGLVDVVLAGGADLWATPLGMAAFGNMGALSKRNDDPSHASRPFDRDRDGFVLAEGGALLALESADNARRRGARPYGQILGFGSRSDAFHVAMPSDDATHAAAAVTGALADAELNTDDVDYINAHATATVAGDPFETKAVHAAFGADADRIPISGTKSTTGHLLSAASAVEAIISLAAIRRNAVPPTINLDNVDPACTPLCHVPHQAQERKVDVVMSNSFGFGGINTSLILGRVA